MSLRHCLLKGDIAQPSWPSGRGREIGTVYGLVCDIACALARPFFYDSEIIATYLVFENSEMAVVGVEIANLPIVNSSWQDVLSHLETEQVFFAIYIDGEGDDRFCRDILGPLSGESVKLDWYT